MQVNMYEAKTHFAELIKSLSTEGEIIIANRGVPVAKLIPYKSPDKRTIGIAEGQYDIPLTVEEFDACNDEIAATFGV